MKKRIAKCLASFFAAMLVLTALSWKLDALRMPQVLCVSPERGIVGGQQSACVLPLEAIYQKNGQYYVYLVENTASRFHPVVARRVEVQLQTMDSSRAAVTGFADSGVQVVRFASRPLTGTTVPVTVWEEGAV